jgi:hypothetical protein
MVVLHLKDVLLSVVVEWQPGRLGSHLGLGSLLLGDERSARSGLGNLDARQTGFL